MDLTKQRGMATALYMSWSVPFASFLAFLIFFVISEPSASFCSLVLPCVTRLNQELPSTNAQISTNRAWRSLQSQPARIASRQTAHRYFARNNSASPTADQALQQLARGPHAQQQQVKQLAAIASLVARDENSSNIHKEGKGCSPLLGLPSRLGLAFCRELLCLLFGC